MNNEHSNSISGSLWTVGYWRNQGQIEHSQQTLMLTVDATLRNIYGKYIGDVYIFFLLKKSLKLISAYVRLNMQIYSEKCHHLFCYVTAL